MVDGLEYIFRMYVILKLVKVMFYALWVRYALIFYAKTFIYLFVQSKHSVSYYFIFILFIYFQKKKFNVIIFFLCFNLSKKMLFRQSNEIFDNSSKWKSKINHKKLWNEKQKLFDICGEWIDCAFCFVFQFWWFNRWKMFNSKRKRMDEILNRYWPSIVVYIPLVHLD